MRCYLLPLCWPARRLLLAWPLAGGLAAPARAQLAPTYAPMTTCGTGADSTPISLAVADVNDDGRPDLLATLYNSGAVGLLLSTVVDEAPVAAPTLPAGQVSVYPNPAQGSFAVHLPGVAGASEVRAELLNSLGQVISQQVASLPATGTTLRVLAEGLAAGSYLLRLTAGGATTRTRVVVQ